MLLTKYNPENAIDTLFKSLDRELFPMVSRFFETAEDDGIRLPRTNINEKDKEYVITMEMPGVSKKDVEVSIDGDTLTIEAQRSEKIDDEGLLRSEIRCEKFRRSFTLDPKIDRDNVKAKLENGLLKVTLPKKAESVGRKVEIS